MMFGFGKKPTASEVLRQQNRELRKAQRGVERERATIEREEKKLEAEIKKAASKGDKELCAVLAKQLIKLRKQKTRTFAASSQISAVGSHAKTMQSNVVLSNAMATTTKTMSSMNAKMNPAVMAKTLQDFSRESEKMNMADEAIEDTLNDILGDSGDEEEQDAIVNKVLDEIGIEVIGKLSNAPAASNDRLGETAAASKLADDEIERQLARLKT